MQITRLVLAILIVAAATCSAVAHVVLEQPEAPIGRSYKAVFKVTHGCDGSPTTRVTVAFPEGVVAVKPMPKPGWTIATTRASYPRAYAFYHGKKLTEGVTSVTWSGGSLPDDFYDEFIVSAFIAAELKPATTLAFTVTQDCEKGQMRWSETAPEGHAHHLEWPAPTLRLLPGRK